MKTKHLAYALTEILVIIVLVVVLMALSVRPMRTLISEIPRSARVCQTLNTTAKALDQLKKDIEHSTQIMKLNNGVLKLVQTEGPVSYTFTDGQITRHPAMNGSGTEFTWQFPHLKAETKLWNKNDHAYAVELTTWNQQRVLDRDQIRFKQTTVFFQKGKQ